MQPIHLGHCKVENDGIWFEFGSFLYCLQSICSFSTNLPVRVSLQDRSQHPPDQLLVVRNENSISQKSSQTSDIDVCLIPYIGQIVFGILGTTYGSGGR